MTPLEKALQLIDKYRFCITNSKGTSIMGYELAIQCSIIYCDEIIKEISEIREYHIELKNIPNLVFKNKLEYYKEVKTELKKLL